MSKCIELHPCDWLITCLRALEQVYLIKWPLSACVASGDCFGEYFFVHVKSSFSDLYFAQPPSKTFNLTLCGTFHMFGEGTKEMNLIYLMGVS